MKKAISIIGFLLLFSAFSVSAQCCSDKAAKGAQSKSGQNVDESAAIKAYYFHATRRCASCQAVESVTKETVKEYGDKVAFSSINREEEKDNPLIKKYEISGQTLLIIKGDEVVNLTNYAFLNARTNPDKLKKKIKETIDAMN